VGILQNLKTRRRQKAVLRATKNPLRPRNKLSYAPDAVSREYRGKIAARKELFRVHAIEQQPREMIDALNARRIIAQCPT
jgi:hypothetical protein